MKRSSAVFLFSLFFRIFASSCLIASTWPTSVFAKDTGSFPQIAFSTSESPNFRIVQISAGNRSEQVLGITVRAATSVAAREKTTIGIECDRDWEGLQSAEVVNVTKSCAGFTLRSDGPFVVEIPFDLRIHQDIANEAVQLFKVQQVASAQSVIRPVDAYLDVENKRTITTVGEAVVKYMNGIVKTGEPSARAPSNFTPSLFESMKKPDITGLLSMVAAPKPGPNGDLALDYPIDLRGLRDSFRPSVSIGYSSTGGYGTLGEGWSLSLPQITVEIRWGVPAFDEEKETETYLFNGQQLVQERTATPGEGNTNFKVTDAPHRTEGLQDRAPSDLKFVLKRSDGLWTFIRHKERPENYFWEASQSNPQSGEVRFYYFGNAPTQQPGYLPADVFSSGQHSQPYLDVGTETRDAAPGQRPIVRWVLTREIDSSGNIIDYDWAHDCNKDPVATANISDQCGGAGSGNVASNEIYLRRMVYYGSEREETLVASCQKNPSSPSCAKPVNPALRYETIFAWSQPGPGDYIRSDSRSGGTIAGGRVLRQISTRMIRNQGGPVQQPAWACSPALVTQTFGYRQEAFGAATGRQLLSTATTVTHPEPIYGFATFSAGQCGEPAVKTDAELAGHQPTRFEYDDSAAWAAAKLESNQNLPNAQGIASAVKALLGSGDRGPYSANLLGSTQVAESGGSFYGGIGFMGPQKTGSFGVKVGFQQRNSYQELTSLVDLSGDGVPDRVIRDGPGAFRVQKGQLDHGVLSFDDPVQPNGLPSDLQREPVAATRHSAFEGHLPAGIYLATGQVTSSAMQDVYLADIDGDRRVDVVYGGTIFYNRSTADAIRFTTNPGDSYFGPKIPVMGALAPFSVQSAGLPLPSTDVATDLMADDIPLVSSDHPRVQVVRRWVAPFDGDVVVDASARLLLHKDQAQKADGVLVSIQHRAQATPNTVAICDLAELRPAAATQLVSAVDQCSTMDKSALDSISYYLAKNYPKKRFVPLSVQKGDEVYFAVHPNFNAEQDVVEWNPTISYVSLLEDEWAPNGTATPKALFGYKLSRPGEPGLDAVFSSLNHLAFPDPRPCGTLTVTDPSDGLSKMQVPENRFGLCDPNGDSYVRYSPGLDANLFADAQGVFSSPMRGTVTFLGKIEKPKTLFPVILRISVAHPSIFTASTNPEEDLLRACRNRVEADRVLTLPAAAGQYDVGFPHDRDLPVYEGSLICAELTMAVNVDWVRDPPTLTAWHEDLSRFHWVDPLSVNYSSKYVEYDQTPDGTKPDIFLRPEEQGHDPVACSPNPSVETCPDKAETASYIAGKGVDTPTESAPSVGSLMLIRIDRKDNGPVARFPLAPSINMSFGRVVRNEANADPGSKDAAVRLHQRVEEIVLPQSSEACSLPGDNPGQNEYRLAVPFYTRGPVPTPNSGVSSIGDILSSIVLRSTVSDGSKQTVTRALVPFARYRIEQPVPGMPGQFKVRALAQGSGLYPQAGERQVDDRQFAGSTPALAVTLLQQVTATADKAGTDVVSRFSSGTGGYDWAQSQTIGLRFCASPGATIAIETAAAAPQKPSDQENVQAITRFEKLWTADECQADAPGGGNSACRITGGALLLGFQGADGMQTASSSVYLPRYARFDSHSPRGASWLSAKAEVGDRAVKSDDVAALLKLVRLPADLTNGVAGAQNGLCLAIGGCGSIGSKHEVADGTGGAANQHPGLESLPLQSSLVDSKTSARDVEDMTASCQTQKLDDGEASFPYNPACGNGPDPSIWIRGKLMSASRVGLKDLTNRRCESVQNLIGGDPNSCDPGYLGPPVHLAPMATIGLRALPRSSKTDSQSISIGGFGAGGTVSSAHTQASTDLLDLNGDGYPDQISGDKVILTGPLGLYRKTPGNAWNDVGNVKADMLMAGRNNPRRSIGATSQFNISFSTVKSLTKVVASSIGLIGGNQTGAPARFGNTSLEPNFAFSPPGLSFGANTSLRSYEFIDMNGDGLPDRISTEQSAGSGKDCALQRFPSNGKSLEISGSCVLSVELNHGYELSAPRQWSTGGDAVPSEKSQNFGVGIQAGYGGSDNRLDYAGGVGADVGASRGFQVLSDINGDGLPDLVSNDKGTIRAKLNNGHGFTGTLDIGTVGTNLFGMGASESDNSWIGAYVTFGFWIPFTPLSVVLNPGVQQSNSLSRQTIALRDFNGDGLPDIADGGAIASGKLGFSNKEATIFYNGLGTRNLLRKVFQATNPGVEANLEFDFDRVGLSNDDPSNHWVLSAFAERDGVAEDDVDVADNTRRTCITYGGGRFDRYERRFLGFQHVDILQGCRDNGSSWDRKIDRTYANWSIYENGLLLEEKVSGFNSRAVRTTTNRYVLIDLAASAPNSGDIAGDIVCFTLPGHDYPATSSFDAIPKEMRRFEGPTCTEFKVALSDPAQTTFDAASRSLQPFLLVTQKSVREDQDDSVEIVTALAYRPDFLGRPVLACDYGALDQVEDDLCSNMQYADHVTVTAKFDAAATLQSSTRALGLVAATTIEELREKGPAGKGKASIVRAATASYDSSTGKLVKTCNFIKPQAIGYKYLPDNSGDENPCEDEQTFPRNTEAMLQARPLVNSISETYFAYDDRGNVKDMISPLSAASDYVHKHYVYDKYLDQVVAQESTVFCRIDNAGFALELSKLALGIEANTKAQARQAKYPKPAQLNYFKAANLLSGSVQFAANTLAGACLAGSSPAPNIKIGSDAGPVMDAFITDNYGLDYRLARMAVSIDANRNMTMTEWDGFGRPQTIRASWASDKDSKSQWSDYGFGGGGDDSAVPNEKPDFGMMALFDYPQANSANFSGLIARLQQYVDPTVFEATNDASGKRTILTNFLFDQIGSPVQTISDGDACKVLEQTRPTTLCQRHFASIASGLVKKDRLGRAAVTSYPVGVETRPAVSDLKVEQDPGSKSLQAGYDGFDRPAHIANPDGNAYDFSYRIALKNGAPLQEVYARDADCVPTRVARNIRGNIVSVSEYWHQTGKTGDLLAAVQVGSSGRDQAGMHSPWIAAVAGKAQQVATCAYSLGEVVASLQHPETSEIYAAVTRYDYDSLGQLVAIYRPARCNFSSSSAITLCAPGQATSERSTTRVGYDAFGRRTWLDDPDHGFSFNLLDLVSNAICTLSSAYRGVGAVDTQALETRCKSDKPLLDNGPVSRLSRRPSSST
ncbi:SpvB/TcaC N-terminal domain-containing protein [Mesorhizobium sp. ArgA1]